MKDHQCLYHISKKKCARAAEFVESERLSKKKTLARFGNLQPVVTCRTLCILNSCILALKMMFV